MDNSHFLDFPLILCSLNGLSTPFSKTSQNDETLVRHRVGRLPCRPAASSRGARTRTAFRPQQKTIRKRYFYPRAIALGFFILLFFFLAIAASAEIFFINFFPFFFTSDFPPARPSMRAASFLCFFVDILNIIYQPIDKSSVAVQNSLDTTRRLVYIDHRPLITEKGRITHLTIANGKPPKQLAASPARIKI